MNDLKAKPVLSKDKSVHVTDEVYNTVISASGALLSLFGCIFLIYRAQAAGHTLATMGFLVYGVSLVAMFTASALHHGINGSERVNHILRQLDYFSIFTLIAGTFTPFCLLFLDHPKSRNILVLVWILAAVGITVKALYPNVSKWFTLAFYIGMGWLAVFIVQAIFKALPWQGSLALIMGGLFFTVGGFIYGIERPNPFPGKFGFHEIWHCFVLLGAGSHFFTMYHCL